MSFFKTANLIFTLLWLFPKHTWTEMLPDEPNCTSNKFSVAKGTPPCWWKTSVPTPSVIFTYSLCDKYIKKIYIISYIKIYKISYISYNDNDNDNDNDGNDSDSDSHDDNDNDYDNDNDNIQWS